MHLFTLYSGMKRNNFALIYQKLFIELPPLHQKKYPNQSIRLGI